MPSSEETSKDRLKHLNAYLFANLIILGVLLIALWTRRPVWDVSIRFPNILLILAIANVLLIFRNVLVGNSALLPKTGKRKKKNKTKKNSLLALRNILRTSASANNTVVERSIEKLRELSGVKRIELHIAEAQKSELVAESGSSLPSINGSRFLLKNDFLNIIHTGKLGEETVLRLDKADAARFESAVTKISTIVVPIAIPGYRTNERLGVLLFADNEGRVKPAVSVAGTALYFETLLALVEGVKQNEQIEYLDKETHMMLPATFKEHLQTEIERSERYSQKMTLLTLQAENFDLLTQEERQLVHKNAGSAIKQVLRRFDKVFMDEKPGRYEVILTEADENVAQTISKRIVKIFAKENTKIGFDSTKNLKLNIGSATYPTDGKLAEAIAELSFENCENLTDKKESED